MPVSIVFHFWFNFTFDVTIGRILIFRPTQEANSPSEHRHNKPTKIATPHILVWTENHCAVDCGCHLEELAGISDLQLLNSNSTFRPNKDVSLIDARYISRLSWLQDDWVGWLGEILASILSRMSFNSVVDNWAKMFSSLSPISKLRRWDKKLS